MKIMDAVEFLHDMVMPRATVKTKQQHIVLHPVCSLEKMKTVEKFVNLARNFAENVTVPVNTGCCGMAGDRGFLIPELTTSATHPEATEVAMKKFDAYYSSTKTCEMAMSEAVKENYESILYLVDESI
jgi:D-lactate dehydrogenase